MVSDKGPANAFVVGGASATSSRRRHSQTCYIVSAGLFLFENLFLPEVKDLNEKKPQINAIAIRFNTYIASISPEITFSSNATKLSTAIKPKVTETMIKIIPRKYFIFTPIYNSASHEQMPHNSL
jgi:hypothetical protein